MQAHGSDRPRRRATRGRGGAASRLLEARASRIDAEAVKQRWLSLSALERQRVLHFEDRQIVEKAYVIQQWLWYSELMCIRGGVHVETVAQNSGCTVAMEAFEFKWAALTTTSRFRAGGHNPSQLDGDGPPDNLAPVPVAFNAKLDFVLNEENFFDRLKRRLGSPLLEGRPSLPREEWWSVFEPTANTWADYEKQVFRLVELAVYYAHQEAVAAEKESGMQEAPHDDSEAALLAAPGTPTASVAQPTGAAAAATGKEFREAESVEIEGATPKGKRKARKRRKGTASSSSPQVFANSSPEPVIAQEDEDPAPEQEQEQMEERFEAAAEEEEEDEEEEEEEETPVEEQRVTAECHPETRRDQDNRSTAELPSATSTGQQEATASMQSSNALAESLVDDDSFEAWETVSRKKRTRVPAAQTPVDVPGISQEATRSYASMPSRRPATGSSSPRPRVAVPAAAVIAPTMAEERRPPAEFVEPRAILPPTPQLQAALPPVRRAKTGAQQPVSGAAPAASAPQRTNSSAPSESKSVASAATDKSSSNSITTTASSASTASNSAATASDAASSTSSRHCLAVRHPTRRQWEPAGGTSSKVLSTWQTNGLTDERVEWMIRMPPEVVPCDRTSGCSGEATVAFRASVKRTFLDVAPVYTEPMRPRARSLDIRLSDICVH